MNNLLQRRLASLLCVKSIVTLVMAAVFAFSVLTDRIAAGTDDLEQAMLTLTHDDVTAESVAVRDEILPRMRSLRAAADEAELMTAESYWPFPTYGALLFGVR